MSSPLREIIALFSYGADTKELDKAEKKHDGFVEKLQNLGGIVAGAFAFHEAKEFVQGIVETSSALEKTAIRTGLATEQLQALEYAAKQSDVAAESLDGSLTKLGKNLVEAKDKGGESAKAFTDAGIAIKDANGNVRSAADALPDIADAIVRIQNPSERAALAIKLFGRSGAELIPFLSRGSKGIREMTEEAKALGGGLSEAAIEGAGELEAAEKRLDFATLSFKSAVGKDLLPLLADVVTGAAKLAVQFGKWAERTSSVRTAVVALGATGLVKLITHFGGLRAILGVVEKSLFRVLLPMEILQDFITFLAGGKSVIGVLLEKAFGPGTAQRVRDGIHQITEAIGKLIEKAGGAKTMLKLLLGGILAFKALKFAIDASKWFTGLAGLQKDLAGASGAMLALYASYQALKGQIDSLNAETEGLGVTGLVGEMYKQGTFDPAKALSHYQDEQARKRAADGTGGQPPAAPPGITIPEVKIGGRARAPVAAVQKGGGLEQHNTVTNNITVPQGTNPKLLRDIAAAARSGTMQGVDLTATHAALVPGSG